MMPWRHTSVPNRHALPCEIHGQQALWRFTPVNRARRMPSGGGRRQTGARILARFGLRGFDGFRTTVGDARLNFALDRSDVCAGIPLFCYAFAPAWPRRGSMSYSSNMLRRTFLQTRTAAAAAMTAAAAEEVPVQQIGR